MYPFVEVDDQEIKRKGVSYTVDTINMIEKMENPPKEIFLIIGVDQLTQFDKWKSFKTIIKKAHLLVCSRKGYEWCASLIPSSLQQCMLPPPKDLNAAKENADGLKKTRTKPIGRENPEIKSWAAQEKKDGKIIPVGYKKSHIQYKMPMKTGKNIYYVALNNMDIASSQIRQRLRQGLPVSHLLPSTVEQWIQKYNLYQRAASIEQDSDISALIKFCIHTLLSKKARKVKAFDLRRFAKIPFDFTLVVSGLNTRHTKVMADFFAEDKLKKSSLFLLTKWKGRKMENGLFWIMELWWCIFFYDYTREYYGLEDLWKGCFYSGVLCLIFLDSICFYTSFWGKD